MSGGWRDFALCRQIADTATFYPGKGESSREAKQICSLCRVRALLPHSTLRRLRVSRLRGQPLLNEVQNLRMQRTALPVGERLESGVEVIGQAQGQLFHEPSVMHEPEMMVDWHHADATEAAGRAAVSVEVEERLKNYEVDSNGCWVWQGYVDRNGYGRVYVTTKRGCYWVHRISYEFHRGPIPDRFDLDHTCQNTRCMNPEHLDAVTKVEHAARTMRRLGKDDKQRRVAVLRQAGLTFREIAEVLSLGGKGSAHAALKSAIAKGLVDADDMPPAPRLTPEEVADIRDLHDLGIPQTVLGEFYGIHSSQVSRLCGGKTYLPPPERSAEGAA